MTREAALEAYFGEAASWDADREAWHARSRRLLGAVALAGWLCAIVTGLALMLLMPLKRVEPFVIRVDRSTGIVDVVPRYTGKASFSQAVTRYFLGQYVTVCERFDYATAEADYEECGAFQTAAENQAWYQKWTRSNPASPLNRYKDGTVVRAQVISVSFFNAGRAGSELAQVRYTRSIQGPGGAAEHVTHWIATIRYGYGPPSSDPQVRQFNPLGFRILAFHADPEVLGEGSSANEASSTAGASQ